MENITLINDDCLNYLLKLPDNSLDLVLTDPPYFIDKLDNKWNSGKITARDTKGSHHTHLPAGMKFSKKQSQELYNFYLKISEIIYTKLKPGGYFLSFSSPRLIHSIAMACDNSGFEIRDQINWIYPVSFPKAMGQDTIINKNKDFTPEQRKNLKEKYAGYKTPQLKSNFEPVCVAMKPIQETFLKNEIKWDTGLINFNIKQGVNSDKKISNIITTQPFVDYPVIDNNFLINKPSKAEKGSSNTHITVKPIELMEHLIEIFSKEGSVILDPFMGSGTTGIACVNSNRKFIGIELNKEYFLISKKRIETSLKENV